MHFVAMGRCADNTSLELLECWQAYSEQLHLNRIPTWSEASEYFNCFSKNLLIAHLEQNLPHKLRKRACGDKERTGVSAFLNILINNTCDEPASNPLTLSRTLIDSTRATRSDHPGHCRNYLHTRLRNTI